LIESPSKEGRLIMDRENQFDYIESQSTPKQPTHEEYVQDKPTQTLQESDFNINLTMIQAYFHKPLMEIAQH
jgi:hypothetical protein